MHHLTPAFIIESSFFVHGNAGAALLPVQFHAPCNTSLYNLHNGNKKSLRKVLDKVPNIGYNSSALERVLYIAGWSSSVARRAHNPKAVGSNPAPATKSPLISREISGFSLFSELFVMLSSGAVPADPYRDPYGNESRLRNSKPGFQNFENPVLVKIIFCYPASTAPMVSAAFFCAAVVTWA